MICDAIAFGCSCCAGWQMECVHTQKTAQLSCAGFCFLAFIFQAFYIYALYNMRKVFL